MRVSRGVLQDRLDQVRRQRRVRLQHQRDGAADDRRRHAGAAQAQVRLVAVCDRAASSRVGGLVVKSVLPGSRERLDADARRDEIRLGREVDRASGRAS